MFRPGSRALVSCVSLDNVLGSPFQAPSPYVQLLCFLGSGLVLQRFVFLSDAKENPYGEDDNKSPFPLQPKNKRSYAQNVTVWIKQNGLQVSRGLNSKPTAGIHFLLCSQVCVWEGILKRLSV